MEYCTVLGVLAVLLTIATVVKLRSSGSGAPYCTFEERAMGQLENVYKDFISRKEVTKRRYSYSFYKKLKIIMVVYMKERFNITVKRTVTDAMRKKITGITADAEAYLVVLFERMEHLRIGGMAFEKVDELFKDSITFFKGRC